MLAVIGWLLLVVLCVGAAIFGAIVFLILGMFGNDGGVTRIVGAIIFALALTGLYNTAKISPFTVTIDTHVYQEHK